MDKVERKTIFFSQYLSGLFAYKHHSGLVKGWIVKDGYGAETRYALFHDGTIAKSEPVDTWSSESEEFGNQRYWQVVDTIPFEAVFTGHYLPPKISRYSVK